MTDSARIFGEGFARCDGGGDGGGDFAFGAALMTRVALLIGIRFRTARFSLRIRVSLRGDFGETVNDFDWKPTRFATKSMGSVTLIMIGVSPKLVPSSALVIFALGFASIEISTNEVVGFACVCT